MMMMEKARQALSKYFGYHEFRPMQEDVIRNLLEGKDVVVLMPTGGGKSICFQIPALTMEGTAVVVSPLIALMKDQVEGLKANGVKAEFINSSRSQEENRQVEQLALMGELQLLYVSPEKLLSPDFFQLLLNIKISLFAIDEAHCISQWGHDFRPEYTQLSVLKQRWPDVPCAALTATADKLTRKDIIDNLALHAPEVFVASFDRPNLSLTVSTPSKKVQATLLWVKQRPGQSGIIYCLSRKSTESLANKLKEVGVKADHYHAGMSPQARARVQEAFVRDDLDVICATIAFGMGIDKSNVRWVLHYNLPKNIEGYYQEIGRAGRDGLPSETQLFYSYGDVVQLQSFIEDSGQKEILQTKLDRMQAYANALTCRRQILLSYFGEASQGNCGNCDNCLDPPEVIDGTVLTQKALSAALRTQEQVGLNMLVDILRGSNSSEIKAKGYQLIRTFGAGSEVHRRDWLDFGMQMLHQGFMEMAYDEGNALKVTDAGRRVLFEGKQVQLCKPKMPSSQPRTAVKAAPKPVPAFAERLFEDLRKLRKEIASENGVPPYVIFSDKTLKQMAEEHPTTEWQMRQVSGVGERKMQLYGYDFIDRILRFVQSQV